MLHKWASVLIAARLLLSETKLRLKVEVIDHQFRMIFKMYEPVRRKPNSLHPFAAAR